MTLILNGTDNSATTPAVTGTDTDTGVYYPAANQVAIATSGTQAMLANASQGVQFANAIGVGATTPTTSGAGITFPATQSASSDANTLDDYEEGTWSPRIENAAGSTSVTFTGEGIYTKVGRMVHVQINSYNKTMTAFGATEQLYIANLPFTSSNSIYVLTFNTYANQPVWALDGGSATKFSLWNPAGAVDYTQFTRNQWGGSGTMTFRGNFVYEST